MPCQSVCFKCMSCFVLFFVVCFWVNSRWSLCLRLWGCWIYTNLECTTNYFLLSSTKKLIASFETISLKHFEADSVLVLLVEIQQPFLFYPVTANWIFNMNRTLFYFIFYRPVRRGLHGDHGALAQYHAVWVFTEELERVRTESSEILDAMAFLVNWKAAEAR